MPSNRTIYDITDASDISREEYPPTDVSKTSFLRYNTRLRKSGVYRYYPTGMSYIDDSLLTLTYLVTDSTDGRPDLISIENYGTDKYWWIVCLANGIVDPFSELVIGKKLKLPTLTNITKHILA